jgi:hypothetical protein
VPQALVSAAKRIVRMAKRPKKPNIFIFIFLGVSKIVKRNKTERKKKYFFD